MNYKHGHARLRTRTYESWRLMKKRCTYSRCKAYEFYGGAGITFCERWSKFENFLEDMGERPEGKTLDRIDCNGNYEPSNCRWATVEEQMMNRKNTVWIFDNGRLLSVHTVAEETGENERTIRWREQKRREHEERIEETKEVVDIILDSLPAGFTM